jgi:putative transposase
LGPAQRHEAVVALQSKGLSKFRACAVVQQPYRSLFNAKKAERKADVMLKEWITGLAHERPRFGWRRLLILTRREIPGTGEHRFRRMYKALNLQVRPRKKRKVTYVRGNPVPTVSRPNERWSIDFMHDSLVNGRTYRTMNVVDDFTCECLAVEPGFSFGTRDVMRCFEAIAFERGDLPETVRFDNGSEFTSRAMLQWGAEKNVALHFIQPGKPTQNAKIESFNGRVRDELLNAHCFRTIDEVRKLAEAWKNDYNEVRPHSTLGGLTPLEFANKF